MFSREDTTPDGDGIFQVGGKSGGCAERTLQAGPGAAEVGSWGCEGLQSMAGHSAPWRQKGRRPP